MTDYYPSSEDETNKGQAAEPSEEREPTNDAEGEEIVIAKTALGGKEFKPGETITLKATHDYGDEVCFAMAQSNPEPKSEMASANDEFDQLAKGE